MRILRLRITILTYKILRFVVLKLALMADKRAAKMQEQRQCEPFPWPEDARYDFLIGQELPGNVFGYFGRMKLRVRGRKTDAD